MTDWTRIYAYDCETYPNVFTIGIVHIDTGTRWIFEVSDRVNQSAHFAYFMQRLRVAGCRMLGFNNEHFDYPIIHAIYGWVTAKGHCTAAEIYDKAMAIIGSQRNDWTHTVYESDRVVPQIDLFKIMHFDNIARSTSLKKLEMNMRSWSVVDLPYPVGQPLTAEQTNVVISYMCHDISETIKFALQIAEEIQFRDVLTERYGRDYTNFNDTKIGKQHFIDKIEASGIPCYERVNGKRQPRQTLRTDGIKVAEKLLPIPFQTAELQRMHKFFQAAVIPPWKTKGFFTDLVARIGMFELVFGAGGIHGSVSSTTFEADDDHTIIDVDVTSYYPSLAIVNRWYPEHIGEVFCDIYDALKKERVGYAKGSPENKMLKLALNGVYGDSNNEFSPFYDPAYTMAITINGQLLLAWLAEMVHLHVPGAQLIQINTDGLTIRLPRASVPVLDAVRAHWSASTGLDLESVNYAKMAVRDVNNYFAIDTKGKVKRKSAYVTEPEWHQDRSSLVVQRAVDAFVQHGTDPVQFIYAHPDPFDFMRHVKVPRSSRLVWGDDQIQNTSRYFISLTGKPLTKIMPPTARRSKPAVYEITHYDGTKEEITTGPESTGERNFAVDKGWMTRPCNVASEFDWTDLNRRFYIIEAQKLIAGLGLRC